MNQNLDSLSDWFRANKLSLNVTKTNYMLYTKSSTPNNNARHLAVGDENISKVKCTKYLGPHIDDKLNCDVHIKAVKSRISRSLFAINKCKCFCLNHSLLHYTTLWYIPTSHMV